MSDAIEICEYQSRDKASCISLLKAAFPGTSDEDTFRWRFEGSRDLKPLIVLAKDRDSVVSFTAWMPWQFTYNGQTLLGYQGGEAATEPAYRGRGLFAKVLKFAADLASEKEIDFLFGFGNRLSSNVIIKSGYRPVFTHNFYAKALNPIGRMARPLAGDPLTGVNGSFLFEPGKIEPVVDRSYMEWRFLQNTKDFQILDYSEDACKAIFVTRMKRWNGFPVVLLIDCQFTSYSEKFCRKAIKFLEQAFSRKAVVIGTFFNENSDRGRVLSKHFKRRIRWKSHVLLVKPLAGKVPENILYNGNNWNLMPHCIDEY